MERINYAAGSVLTGNDIAHAIATYAKALALNNQSDTVSFPVLLDTGQIATAEVLIGPASQIMNIPEPSDHDDVTDDNFIQLMTQKTNALGISRPEAETDEDTENHRYDY
jgi:hypothetical protein